MGIRYRQIHSMGGQIAAKIADCYPMTQIGLVNSQVPYELRNCGGLFCVCRPAHKFARGGGKSGTSPNSFRSTSRGPMFR